MAHAWNLGISEPPRWHSFLDLRQLGRRRWITLSPLVYSSGVFGGTITVPAEFITDLASVPRLPVAWWIAGDRARGPAVLHDWLYQHPGFGDRSLADAVFLEAMGVHQPEFGHEAEPILVRTTMWSAVRAFGWMVWHSYERRASALNPEWSSAGWPDLAEAP